MSTRLCSLYNVVINHSGFFCGWINWINQMNYINKSVWMWIILSEYINIFNWHLICGKWHEISNAFPNKNSKKGHTLVNIWLFEDFFFSSGVSYGLWIKCISSSILCGDWIIGSLLYWCSVIFCLKKSALLHWDLRIRLLVLW